MRRVQTGSEERVQGTANDAAIGKLSAASLGYFEDRFLEVLVRTARTDEPARRLPPVINRGKAQCTVVAKRACCIHGWWFTSGLHFLWPCK